MIMPILLGLLCAVLVASLVVGFLSTRKRNLCNLITWASIVALVIFGGLTAVVVHEHNAWVSEMRVQQEELTLYQNVIADCNDEYVRYDFYTKVMKFNEDYEALVEDQNNIWAGYFCADDLLEGLAPIQFELHGGNYEVAD